MMIQTRVLSIPGTLTALSPISHIGDEKTGNTPTLRSMTTWSLALGKQVTLPYISGNAIRGMLRRLVMRDMVDIVGYSVQSPKLHHALYTGGILEGSDDAGTVDIGFRNHVRNTVPPLGLLGTAVGSQMLPGCLIVDNAQPICVETAHLVAEDDPRKQHRARTFTDILFATRRDDLRAERGEDEQAMQMKIELEVFIVGTSFIHGFSLKYPSELEVSCLGRTMQLWAETPFIGGKSGSGFGRVKMDYQGVPDGRPYLTYLQEQAEAVRAALQGLADRLDGKHKPEGEEGTKRGKGRKTAAPAV